MQPPINSHTNDLVSIVMLTVNRPQYIDLAIRSVITQNHSCWELIVVHDGPDQRIAPFMQTWLATDSRIRFYHREKLGNIGSAMNFAICQARGEWIAVLDDDDAWLEPEKLARQLEMLAANATLFAVGGGAVVIDAVGRELMRYTRSLDPASCKRMALLANPIIHSTVMYRRAAWEKVGGYDESLPEYQDWDFFLKIMRMGEVANLPQPLGTYRIWDGGSSTQKTRRNAWSALRITWRHRRHYPRAWLAIAISGGYMLFALLPGRIRRHLYQGLSRLKKRLFTSQSQTT